MRPARDGVALVAALTLVTLLGIGVAAMVASSVVAHRSTRLGQGDAASLSAAEYGAASVLGNPNGYGLAALPLGAPREIDLVAPETSPVPVRVVVTRLPDGVLWIVSEAGIGGRDSSEHRISVVARFPALAPTPMAGIVSRGDVVLAPDVAVSVDTAGDADCAASAGARDVVVMPGATVTAAAGVRAQVDAAAGDSSLYLLTAVQRAALATATGVRHVAGDTTITGGSFDGILVVDGSLTIGGPFVANGLVVVGGTVRTIDAGFRINGALLSSYAGSPHAVDLAGATIRFVPCAAAALLRGAMPPKLVRERGWTEFY